jgi:hypothetical protein
MLVAARRRLAALRQPPRAVRLARALWVTWAIVVWNVVFDRILVVAGRRYALAAELATRATPRTFISPDDWMRPAVSRGLWIATTVSCVILIVGFWSVHLAARTYHLNR